MSSFSFDQISKSWTFQNEGVRVRSTADVIKVLVVLCEGDGHPQTCVSDKD